ncbi:MAG: hypothetical protein ACOCYQ_08405, partial [Alkalispirochaeta sp.]
VNEKDIAKGLFTPDVPVPREIPPGEGAVFYSKLAMAVSTEAEMMTRYGDLPGSVDADRRGPDTHGIDGETSCLQRYHVTGGTNGVLVDHLRRHRPFTPTFVGRAEDQAFILSVLYEDEDARGGAAAVGATGEASGSGATGEASRPEATGSATRPEATERASGSEATGPAGRNPGYLRYLHKPGLIMRHDKEAFAGESIRAATHGRFIGDLARTWIFTRYSEALPWPLEQTKGQIDPFTGSFVTPIPYTIILLRLVIYCAALGEDDAAMVLDLAERKLAPLFGDAVTVDGTASGGAGTGVGPDGAASGAGAGPDGADGIAREYRRQRAAWNAFYRALDAAEGRAVAGSEAPPTSAAGTGAPSSPAKAAHRIVAEARIV